MELPMYEAKEISSDSPESKGSDENNSISKPERPNGNGDQQPDDDDDDYEETYGDLEDGHDDLNNPESDRGVDNLE